MLVAATSIVRGSRVVSRGASWQVLDASAFADCTALTLLRSASHGADEVRRTLLTPFDRVRSIDGPTPLRVVGRQRWVHAVRRAALEARPRAGLSAGVDAIIDLNAWQLEPAIAALRDGASRLLVADAVGLGKTIQAGLLLAELRARDEGARALVLTPAGLRAQWARELRSHFQLDPVVADGDWLAHAARELPADVNPWVLAGTYITSYDFLKRPEVLRAVEDLTWDAVVVDEAHNATIGTARLHAVHSVAARARHVVLLTATPHSGSAVDFHALCGIGTEDARRNPILLFRRTRAAVAGRRRHSAMLAVRPTAAERRMHRLLDAYGAEVCREARGRGDTDARLAVIVLRKRALSSAWSLAVSVRRRLELLSGRVPEPQQIALPLAEEDRLPDDVPDAALGVPGLADAPRERRLLQGVLVAAQEAARAESKLGRLQRLIARVREPLIVFTEYRDTLARLRDALCARGFHPVVLHGAQAAAERDGVQQRFNRDGGLLLATDAAAEGLNLHGTCRIVVHYELPWSPGRLEQRAGRVDRIGQCRTVHEIALVAAGTAERLVLVPLVRRLARARGDLPASFSEASIAAAVLDGSEAPVEIERPLAADLYVGPAEDLAAAAAAELLRLERLRRWRSSRVSRRASRHHGAVPVTCVRTGTAGLRTGTVAVFTVSLTQHGRVLDSDLVAVHTPAIATVGALPALLEVLAAWLREALQPRLDAVAAAVQGSWERRAERDLAIRHCAWSASRQLVQPGLFDRRTARERRSGEERAATFADIDPPAIAPAAVLFVGNGRLSR